ncbi:MAG: winged helix-turn-helix domain-containing protein [Halosimplex sp.]
MTDDSDGPADTEPEDAFALIGDETRAGILRALGEDPHEGVSFSELRERVDPEIDSGQFNYHLSKLVGQFVDRGEEGYTMRAEGLALYRLIRAGSVNRRASLDPFDAGFDCHFCGTGVEGSYADGAFELRCPGCDHVYSHTHVPPRAVEAGDAEDLLDRVARYNRHEMFAHARGVCPTCVNALETGFVPGEEVWIEGSESLDVFVRTACDHCGARYYMSVGLALLSHPEVVSFFRDRGVDLSDRRHWELEWAMTDRHLTVRSTDPWEVALSIPCEDETLELVVDDSLTVVEATR